MTKLVISHYNILIINDILCMVTIRINAGFVGRLGHIRDMAGAVLGTIADSGRNACVFHYVGRS